MLVMTIPYGVARRLRHHLDGDQYQTLEIPDIRVAITTTALHIDDKEGEKGILFFFPSSFRLMAALPPKTDSFFPRKTSSIFLHPSTEN
jgi:hypothetical protein